MAAHFVLNNLLYKVCHYLCYIKLCQNGFVQYFVFAAVSSCRIANTVLYEPQASKMVFGVSDQDQYKPTGTVTEES